jgi:hypothetical protein
MGRRLDATINLDERGEFIARACRDYEVGRGGPDEVHVYLDLSSLQVNHDLLQKL